MASSIFGAARSTLDADVVADIRPEQAKPLVDQLQADYYIDEQMIRDAIRHRASFNLIHLGTMLKVDVFIQKVRPYDQEAARRVREETIEDTPGARTFYVASPEDMVLAKFEWYRLGGEVSEQQWKDVQGVLKTQGAALDLAYMRQWAPSLGVADLLERALTDAAP